MVWSTKIEVNKEGVPVNKFHRYSSDAIRPQKGAYCHPVDDARVREDGEWIPCPVCSSTAPAVTAESYPGDHQVASALERYVNETP